MRYIFLTGLACLLLFSCTSEKKEPTYDAQYLPDGVEVSRHRKFVPGGNSFQGQRLDPPFWWSDMEMPTLQLLLYDKDIGNDSVTCDYSGIEITEIHRVDNPNYLFLEIALSETVLPGTAHFSRLRNGIEEKRYAWELRRRIVLRGDIEPVNASDVVYLIMPDRFANGDTINDDISNMRQTGIDRSKMYFRHGGDLQGIIDHLDYISELGVTTIWLNPVLENDQPYASYHGYAMTDHYKIDPRFGDNELYRTLSQRCRELGMKLMMDVVPNHCGDHHWFIRDIPSADWVHQFNQFTRTNHNKAALVDPHAAEYDRRLMTRGWFDHSMPDLNHSNPFLAAYLIQNMIWWIEYAGLDGFRIDTYPYVEKEFLNQMILAIRRQYPGFPLIGETWTGEAAILAKFEEPVPDTTLDKSEFASMKDFPLCFSIHRTLTGQQGWDNGVHDLHRTLAQDFLYPDPNQHMTFLDNHDMDRFFTVVGENFNLWKSGVALLMTMRGIPSFYYGTELLMTGRANPDGLVRQDFPGGWEGDPFNKFYEEGRTEREQEAFQYFKTLASYRKNQTALTQGELIQFAPQGNSGIYGFLRRGLGQRVLVLLNISKDAKKIPMWQYREEIGEVIEVRDIINRRNYPMQDSLTIPAETTLVLELK